MDWASTVCANEADLSSRHFRRGRTASCRCASGSANACKGTDVDVWQSSKANDPQITLALALVWTLANTAVKLSILHFYITIFRTRTFRYAAYVVMALTAGYAITNLTQLLLICRPVVFNWDKTIVGGTCSTEETPFLASACINMSIDVIIVVLPMPMLWRLQMPTQKKVALSGIFGIGAL